MFKAFYEGLVLPCSACMNNYRRHLDELPIDQFLETKFDLAYWVYQMHDKVNQMHHKKSPPFSEVTRKYMPAIGTCKEMSDLKYSCIE